MTKHQLILGIDEVGRGPLAGPVALCGIWMNKDEYEELRKTEIFKKLRDSKGLSEKRRLEWYERILGWQKEGILDFSYVTGSARKIDDEGISPTIKKCVKEIMEEADISPESVEVLLDGSLSAPEKYVYQQSIIKGDESEPIISLASIVAKVTRDNWMTNKGKEEKYIKYGFGAHKGYGTLMHREAIKKYGVSDMHRVSYCRNVK